MKKIVCIILCIIFLFSVASCKIFDSTEEISQYDYLVAELQERLKSEYGYILQFESPNITEGYEISILDWQIEFTKEYINESHLEYCDLYGLTEQIRSSMNEYFAENPDSLLLKYYLRVFVAAPPLYDDNPCEIIAQFFNQTAGNVLYQQLVAVNYQYYDFSDYIPTSCLVQVNLREHNDIDSVRLCIENLGYVEIVLIRPEFKSQLSNEYPDICFV